MTIDFKFILIMKRTWTVNSGVLWKQDLYLTPLNHPQIFGGWENLLIIEMIDTGEYIDRVVDMVDRSPAERGLLSG